jgi:integrase
MTQRLYGILIKRYLSRDKSKLGVFCNIYTNPKNGKKVVGPFKYRKTILKTLCKRAGVKEFTFHALRHFGASIMDNQKVPTGSIQKILGHENRITTEIYLHSIGNSEQEAISIYERTMRKSHTDSHTAQ